MFATITHAMRVGNAMIGSFDCVANWKTRNQCQGCRQMERAADSRRTEDRAEAATFDLFGEADAAVFASLFPVPRHLTPARHRVPPGQVVHFTVEMGLEKTSGKRRKPPGWRHGCPRVRATRPMWLSDRIERSPDQRTPSVDDLGIALRMMLSRLHKKMICA